MLQMFKNWINSLPNPADTRWEFSSEYSMIKVATVDNATIWARITSPSWQKSQNYIKENKCYADGKETEAFMCLMPNVNNVYFEVMLDGNFNKRIGMSNLVEFSKSQKESIQEYVDQVLLHQIKNKISHYNEILNK